jgi:antitoxin component YwqK of YwqJK toxin-antitoxin module
MRQIFVIFFSLSTVIVSGQSLPNNFIIGNFFEVFKTDSVRIYFNCTGAVVDRNCADYARVGRMDSIDINVSGEFKDYDIEGRLVFKASIVSNFLDGHAQFFHNNGQIKEEGEYRRDLREGKWTYYYSDGSVEKVLSFTEGDPIVIGYFAKNGKPKVVDRNGDFKTEFSGFRQCQPFEAWGEIKNGKKNGKWTFYNPAFNQNVATEIYQDGLFIKGFDTFGHFEYKDQPKISFKKFYANENLHIEENYLGCPGNKGIFYWKYNGQNIHKSFYPDLQKKLNDHELKLKNQWVIVGIQINETDNMSNVNISSSIDDGIIENFILKQISEMKEWESAKINLKKVSYSIFFTILVRDNSMLIPTDYIYHNRR